MVKEKKKRKSNKRGVYLLASHAQLRKGCTHPVFSVSINGWVFSVQPCLPSCSQQQQQQRCVCIVMPTSKGYIITEGRRRGLWEAVDRMRGSNWLPQQSDFRRGGAVGEVDCSAVSFSDINSLFSVTRNSSCPVGAAVFRVRWRLPNQNDAGFRQTHRMHCDTETATWDLTYVITVFPPEDCYQHWFAVLLGLSRQAHIVYFFRSSCTTAAVIHIVKLRYL